MTIAMRTPQAKLARNGASVVVSLEALRDAVRTRWDSISGATTANLERLFRLKLGAADLFVQIDELHWLVVMPGSRIEDALTCCLRIAYELHVSVIPACDLTNLNVARAAATDDDTLDLMPLTCEQLAAVAYRAGLEELLAGHTVKAEAPSHCRFEPVWDAQRQLVGCHRCVGESAPGSHESIGLQLKHTQAMLGEVIGLLEKQAAQQVRGMLFVPIPYDVLAAPPARMELLSACRQLNCNLRPFLVFEIITLTAGIPKQRLIELVSAIQPFGRAVIARVAPRNPSLLDYGGVGLKAIGFELTGSQTEPVDIAKLCEAGRRLGIGSYLGNMTSARLLDMAVGKGVQWVSGPVIGATGAEPAPPSRQTFQAIVQTWEQPLRAGANG